MGEATVNWLRLHHSILDCRKLQSLPDREFKAWVNMLLIASENDPRGELPSFADLAFRLRLREDFVSRLISKFARESLVDHTNGVYSMHDWLDWQPPSDDVNQRVKKFRDKQRNVACNVTGNGPDRDKIEIREEKKEL